MLAHICGFIPPPRQTSGFARSNRLRTSFSSGIRTPVQLRSECMSTPFHAKCFAHELTLQRPSDSIDKLASALPDIRANVALNPHQVDAALFAFSAPLSKGAILADEVGLGKTIESGIVLSQKWAERRRRLLIVVPANLRHDRRCGISTNCYPGYDSGYRTHQGLTRG